MSAKLSRIRIKRISLCSTPANEHARVVLYKSASRPLSKDDSDAVGDDEAVEAGMMTCKGCGKAMSKDATQCPNCGEKVSMKINLDAIKDEATRKAVEQLQADHDKAVALAKTEGEKATAAEARAVAAEKKAADAAKDPEAELLKSLPESVRKRIEKAEADSKAAQDAVKAMAEKEREREFVSMAKAYTNLSVDAAKFGPVLKRVHDGTSSKDDVAEIDRVLKAANSVAKAHLFTQKGSSERGAGAASGEAWAEIQKLAEEKRESVMKSGGKMTLPEAMDAVIKAQPELYQRHLSEFSQKVAKAGTQGALAEEE